MSMFRCCILVLAICLTSVAQEASNSPALRPVTVIRAGVLIDGKSDSPRHNQVIVIAATESKVSPMLPPASCHQAGP